MPMRQIHAKSSPLTPVAKDVEPGQISHSYGDGKFAAVTLGGHAVDKSRTGRSRATKYIYALNAAHWTLLISVLVNVVFYTIKYLYQDVSTAATISANFTGAASLLAVLGGFLSDALLGHYVSIVLGTSIQTVGLALLLLSVQDPDLQPPACTPSLTALCPPAGGKYTAVLFVALYTIALGTGINHANIGTFGAEQFDESDLEEQKESIHFFVWLYFAQNVGAFLGFTLSVYLLNYKSKGWAFGYLIPLLVVALAIFLLGTPKYRHKKVGGSFLTRIFQVTTAALAKSRLPVPEDESRLHDEPVSGGWIKRSSKLRFLDKASIVDENHPTTSSKWRLPGITQVEETKRIYAVLPVWLSTCFLSVAFSQVVTFTATQGATLDRRWGPHFVLPAQTLGAAVITFGVLAVPIYDFLILPTLRKITGNPYGVSPLKRTGVACLSASLSMMCAALVERKRLTYIRRLGYTLLPIFELPMSMWWLLPQYFFCGLTEMFLFISLYEFYYHEVSDATRSIAVSFLYSALSIGFFFSSVIVNITNHVTKHRPGGEWLKERLNNGGLERYYWVLAVIGAVNFLFYLLTSSLYRYNYDLFYSQLKGSRRMAEPNSTAEREIELEPEAGPHGGLDH